MTTTAKYTTLADPVRCAAAHVEDTRACVGGVTDVRVIDSRGGEATACVLHGAVLLASLSGGRVYPLDVEGAAIAAYILAQELTPYAWRGQAAADRAAVLRAKHAPAADDGCAPYRHASSWAIGGGDCPFYSARHQTSAAAVAAHDTTLALLLKALGPIAPSAGQAA